MTAVSKWLDMMPHTVTLAPFSGTRDRLGQPSFGTAVSYRARVVYKAELVRGREGAEEVARGHVWIAGVPTATPEDQITLPDGSTPDLLAVETIPDEDGDHHVKIFFK